RVFCYQQKRRVLLYDALPVSALASERRQADAGRIKTAVDGKDLSGDVAGTVAAQEEDRFRQFFFEAIAVERDRVMIVGTDFRRVNRLCHGGVDRAGRDGVDTNAERGQVDRELLGEM